MTLLATLICLSSRAATLAVDFTCLPFRIALSMLPLKRKCVLIVHILYTAIVCRMYRIAQEGGCSEVYDRAPLLSVVLMVYLVNIPLVVQERLAAEHKATERAATMCSAAMRLLDILCDAVLQLGEGLECVANVPKLVGMLFLQGGTSLEGEQLTKFMDPENYRHFADILTGVGAGGGPSVGAFNITLNDAIGNQFTWRLFTFTSERVAAEPATCWVFERACRWKVTSESCPRSARMPLHSAACRTFKVLSRCRT
eukprot:TRINITY_DN38660_c0_g3_i1.p1 TRINITY_DN38660_c0_g3~~TRINITY_DN38660_c0_g3_i1.p1  ORF type:complete len:299 (-),score=22.96 TRINITY_DN38660_c0_g3_i1:207-971(-)